SGYNDGLNSAFSPSRESPPRPKKTLHAVQQMRRLFVSTFRIRQEDTVRAHTMTTQLHPFTAQASDPNIIPRIVAGDADAFGLLVQKYYRAVFATAWSHLKNRESAKELA